MNRYTKATLPSFARVSLRVLPPPAVLGVAVAAVAVVTAPFAAHSADDIRFPAGYRNWYHANTMVVAEASPLFKDLGGMHNVYVNAKGLDALKKGTAYPDKTVFVSDVHQFTVTDGSYVEGDRKALATMVKDSKKYASTGGWGFQVWLEGKPEKPGVTDATKQCFECHQPKKDQDYVFSTYLR